MAELVSQVAALRDELAELRAAVAQLQERLSSCSRAHRYELELRWSGNTGSGTSGYGAYSRDSDSHRRRQGRDRRVLRPGLPG